MTMTRNPAIYGCMVLLWATPVMGQATAQNTLVEMTESGLSIRAQGVDLGRLLAELDAVAGTESTVPPEFYGNSVNVWFEDLGVDEAVRHIFDGLGLDYAIIGQKRIVVTAVSQPVQSQRSTPTVARSTPPALPQPPRAGVSNPFQIPGVATDPSAAENPAPFASPFGVPFNPQGGAANGPGPFPSGNPFGVPRGNQNTPPASPGQPDVFGNTSPLILDLNQMQPGAQPPPSPFPTAPPQQP